MTAKIISKQGGKLVIEVEMDLDAEDAMLDKEALIRAAVNEAGALTTAEALKKFDSEGNPVVTGGRKYTSKGEFLEKYECPYGTIKVSRHVYQSSSGGKTFCPLESAARLILNSTPAYAKIISGQYSRNGAIDAATCVAESLGRRVCPAYVRMIGDSVGELALAQENEWCYDLPQLECDPVAVSVGLDGTCMLLCDSGWREAMVGTISLYDQDGNRLHTIYTGAFPEYDKAEFLQRFDAELSRIKAAFPALIYIGLADGAVENWSFLSPRTERQIVDFYHVSEYVKLAAGLLMPRSKKTRDAWLDDHLHQLKHDDGAAQALLEIFLAAHAKLPVRKRSELEKVITYFQNHVHQMNYSAQLRDNLPIGSGVTEAACKELIKQRLCNSGMRWKKTGASAVIAIRSLVLTKERWFQFWNKISLCGTKKHPKFSPRNIIPQSHPTALPGRIPIRLETLALDRENMSESWALDGIL
eukprot:TRINITY_DN10912_c0_g1_i1.p1 TRINITY_DN10912_c0_g1~~TRINITY_DN10912_c0_g1_i1.p1  ORF type:complete len:471 (-),score=58.49 TRINITY_DN10912_c0_g1_i1:591-2003(-)